VPEVLLMKYRVLIEQDEDNMFIAECPSLPGCISQGKTRKEALKNIEDAIRGYIESLKTHDEPVPPPVTEEVIEVVV
jgi:antitoxin HicB